MTKTKNARKRNATSEEPSAQVAKVPRKARAAPLKLPIPQRAQRVGTLLCCGKNDVGQLGLGEDVGEKERPAPVPGCSQVVDIAAGGMHSLYLDAAGAVYSFGCNDEGALGRDTTADGSEYEVVRVDLPLPVVRISTGDSHSACLLEDGRVMAWGAFRDSHGSMGLTLEGNKRFPVEVVPKQRFVDISSGADHLVMLGTDGKVFTVGCAEQGQLGRVTSRSSGGESRRGKSELLVPGQVRFRGGPQVVVDAIWATTYCTFTRVHNTNEIIAFGLNNYTQLAVQGQDLFFNPKVTTIQNVKDISGGQHHTLMLTADGKCLVIGNRDYGRLGLGKDNTEHLTALKEVSALSGLNVVQVECGEVCSFARTADGLVYVWGLAENHQLGLGSDEDVYEPVLLASKQVKDKEVLNVNSGGQHTLLLVVDKVTNGEKPAAEVVAKAADVPAAAAIKVNGTTAADSSSSTTTTTTAKPAKATTAAAKKRAAQASTDAVVTAESAAESAVPETVAEPTVAVAQVAKKRAHAPSTTSDATTADSSSDAATESDKKKAGKAPAKKRK